MHGKEEVMPMPEQERPEGAETALDEEAMRKSILTNLYSRLAKTPESATVNDWYTALVYAVRDRMLKGWIGTMQTYTEDMTVVALLSSEFVLGPQLGISLINLGIAEEVNEAVKGLGLSLKDLKEHEPESGLGSGSYGALAASSMESLATLGIPAIGYGVRYEFGSFRQEIKDGWQVEKTDKWLYPGNPWEIARPEIAYTIALGGHTESYYDTRDCFRVRWIPKFSVRGTAYDIPITGYKSAAVNLLRLWKAEAVESFQFESFNAGDYFSAVNEKIASESISKILYPDDQPYAGKQLRLAQQYFFVSCALQDMIRLHLLRWKGIHTFSDSFAVHLNDAQTAIAVPELMRLLVDEHLVNWDKAWYITQNTFSCTSNAMLHEALEKWPVPLFADILPRHLEIIYEINKRFLDEISLKYPDRNEQVARLSLIDEGDQKYVKTAHLAALGSHGINGVSENQSAVLRNSLFADLYELYPERFFNVTNGVNPRRWMLLCNPRLAELITATIGDRWLSNLEELRRLESFANDPNLIKKWQQAKHENKGDLAAFILEQTGISVSPDALFDIHWNRFHEYKRQHLTILYIIALYNRIKKDPQRDITPCTFLFGGKASPGYFPANLIIKLINSVGDVVNNDPDVGGRLTVVFLPNLNEKNGQKIYPAADLAEQTATAGREASGAENVKFGMNGALTIGTFSGATLEIRKEIGSENMFLFGMTAEEIAATKSKGYNPMVVCDGCPELKEAIECISTGFFSKMDTDLFKPFIDSLLRRDEYMVLADYQSYRECQDRIRNVFAEKKKWAKMSIHTVAGMGTFSSDRAIREYNEKIWHAAPLKTDAGEL